MIFVNDDRDMAKWSFFGGAGIIAENIHHEQRKAIKYNHLMVNMVILHNVVGMTNVLKVLREENHDISEKILAGLAPFGWLISTGMVTTP